MQAKDDRAYTEQATATALLAAQYPLRADLTETWETCRRLTPHVLALTSHEPLPQTMPMRSLANRTSMFLRDQGQIDAALPLAEAGLQLSTALHGPDDQNTGAAQAQLGLCLRDKGDFTRAELSFAEALRISRAGDDKARPCHLPQQPRRGAERPRPAGKAKARYEEALKIGTELHGPRSREVSIRLNNLALVNWALAAETGEAVLREEAITQARDALEIEGEQPLPDEQLMGFRAHNLGSYLLLTGAWDEAEAQLDAALAHRLTAYQNPSHPNVADIALWLATCCLIRIHTGSADAPLRARIDASWSRITASPWTAAKSTPSASSRRFVSGVGQMPDGCHTDARRMSDGCQTPRSP